MNEQIRVDELSDFDVAEHLKSPQDIAAYLTLVIEEGDDAELAHALGIAARSQGMTQVARDAGMTRESLYKALRPGAKPRFETIRRVCKALGVHIAVVVDEPVVA